MENELTRNKNHDIDENFESNNGNDSDHTTVTRDLLANASSSIVGDALSTTHSEQFVINLLFSHILHAR